ncbi:hypothetical protein M514_22235 [Trichuris suis]|uniref:Integrase catalytic domain-containing protein n=1 Tax=Trichuris suis TaxID=68888 RepID=A0A085N844_9BILA|nr:hypothetical protein M514_22235 [Trichuris suis]
MYWTDSTTVLQWIASKTMKFPVFVANRIAEILDESEPKQWRYVPGSMNPADDLSRGLHVEDLRKEHRWFSGPPFLKLDETSWPASKGIKGCSECDNLEQRVTVIVRESNPLSNLFERRSSFKSILRTVAYVWRFGARFRAMVECGPLKADELKTAKLICMRSEQRVYFSQEMEALSRSGQVLASSRVAALRPYLDAQGLMRVGGRLRRAELPEVTQHPVIMSPRSTMLRRMIWERHLELMHAGSERVLADLRTEVWVLSGRRCVRGILKSCLYCRRLTAKPVFPRMADLPTERTDFKHPAFSNVGIDFFGPLEVSLKRSQVKRYGLIFTCLTTRAAHLEVAYTMDVHSFIGALRRFIARRGCPSTIVSDNAKTFVGTNALQQKEQLDRFLADRSTRLVGGGAWERLIAVAKKALSATLRGNSVDDETLLTVFAEVEALLNGRPLTYLTDDPDCVEPLTPFHLLIGRQNAQIPSDVVDNRISLRRHWKTAQLIVNRFWKRWLREYLPTLQRRDKWWNDTANLRVGDFVLVIEPTVKRGEWLTGRVVRVIDSPDGIIRKAIVKTKLGPYERPVTRLALLEGSKSTIQS